MAHQPASVKPLLELLEHSLTDEERRSLIQDPTHASFPADEKAMLDLALLFAKDAREITNEHYAELRKHFSEEQVVTLCMLMALSRRFGDMANALHIPLDAFVRPPV